jgi:cytochrome c553
VAPAPVDDPVVDFAADPHHHMKAHFVRAMKMQDAVLSGNLGAAQVQARWLASHDKEEAPEGWHPYLKTFQTQASAVANAASIDDAAAAVAQIARACGDCHAANHAKPKFGSSPVIGKAANVKAHMTAQLEALDRLWDGLVIPSDKAWTEGAGLLAHVAVPQKALQKEGLDKADSATLLAETLRRLSSSAAKAGKSDRPQTYAQLLTTCVACHVSVRNPLQAAAATGTTSAAK